MAPILTGATASGDMDGEEMDLRNFTLPVGMNLESSLSLAMPAMTREVISNSGQQIYKPGDYIYVNVPTGDPGAFTDPKFTKVQFTLRIINKNYGIDMINFGRAGAQAIIKNYAVELGGIIHTENRFYDRFVEFLHIKENINPEPFEMARSNPWRPAEGLAGDKHINFVKPSMVLSTGIPICCKYTPMSTASGVQTPDFYTQGLVLNTNPFASQHAFGRNATGTAMQGQVQVNNSADLLNKTKGLDILRSGGMTSTDFCIKSSYSDLIPSFSHATEVEYFNTTSNAANRATEDATGNAVQVAVNTPGNTDNRHNVSTVAVNAAIEGYNQVGTTIGPAVNFQSDIRLVGLPHSGKFCGKQSVVYGSVKPLEKLSGLLYGESINAVPAGMWPAYQPTDIRKLRQIIKDDVKKKGINMKNVIDYYGNCKNIDVGIPVDLSNIATDGGSGTIWGDIVQQFPIVDPRGHVTSLQISMPIYCSFYGKLAIKYFPDLLIPSSKLRLRFGLQDPNIVFQTTMCPTRVVPGTYRNWYPYLGVTQTKSAGTSAATTTAADKTVSQIQECGLEFLASGVHPILVADYAGGITSNAAVTIGRYCVPQCTMKALHNVYSLYRLNPGRAGGVDNIAPKGLINMSDIRQWQTGGQGFDAVFGAIATTPNASADIPRYIAGSYAVTQQALYELRQNQVYGYPLHYESDAYTGANVKPVNISGVSLTADANVPNTVQTAPNVPTTILQAQQYNHPTDHTNRSYNQLPMDHADARCITTTQWDDEAAARSRCKTDPNFDYQYKALQWDPFCVPKPQYVPFASPYDKQYSRKFTTVDFLNEKDLCFGTYLEEAVPQVRRTHVQFYPLDMNSNVVVPNFDLRNNLTYEVANFQVRTQQIIVPRSVARLTLQAALTGGIVIPLRVYLTTEYSCARTLSQNIPINIVMSSCEKLYFTFTPQETIVADNAYAYKEVFYNPYINVEYLPMDGKEPKSYNWLGGKEIQVTSEYTINSIGTIKTYLKVGSEYVPRNPISQLQTFLDYQYWSIDQITQQYSLPIYYATQPSQTNNINYQSIDCIDDGYFAPFLKVSQLDDQTITDNPFWTPLEMSLGKKIRGERGQVQPLPFFVPLRGEFFLGISLESFMGESKRMKTGIPLFTNSTTLMMENTHLMANNNTIMTIYAEGPAVLILEKAGVGVVSH